MKESTRERILETGARIIHRNGFNNTGIQEILSAAEIPKGSFYFYFDSKEDFGLQVIDHFSNRFAELAEEILDDESVPPLERIDRILEWFMGYFKASDYSCGCPIGNLAQEMGDLSPTFREKLTAAIDTMAEKYSKVLAEARDSGEIPDSLDVRETAYFIIGSWHGALIRMKLVRSVEPLESHKRFVFDYILRR
jgi:TetR/AcrR family transcriptional repressor of nem operon